MSETKGTVMETPDWVHEIKDDEVWSSIMAFLFAHTFYESDDVDNLKAEIKEAGLELSDAQVEEVAKLLIEHGCVKKK